MRQVVVLSLRSAGEEKEQDNWRWLDKMCCLSAKCLIGIESRVLISQCCAMVCSCLMAQVKGAFQLNALQVKGACWPMSRDTLQLPCGTELKVPVSQMLCDALQLPCSMSQGYLLAECCASWGFFFADVVWCFAAALQCKLRVLFGQMFFCKLRMPFGWRCLSARVKVPCGWMLFCESRAPFGWRCLLAQVEGVPVNQKPVGWNK